MEDETARVAETEADPNLADAISKSTSRFWQALLLAEVSVSKSRVLFEDLGSSPFDLNQLRRHPALAPEERKRLEQYSDDALKIAQELGANVHLPHEFPELLAEADVAPAIYTLGDQRCLERPTVAIVGTRDASVYGRACAQKFGEALARAGVTVISGGAHGIDTAAHKGALHAGGSTAAVLAGGVDHVYPSVNAGLFRQIQESGCLVSQFAIGSKPRDYKFLIRNGLIAALSHAVVVIEAPVKSGALFTAVQAAELGREVFVIPANVDMASFRGSFNLLRDGATLVYHPNQVLEALDLVPVSAPELAPASTTGERILAELGTNPIPSEMIVERTGLSTSEVLSELTMLELDGRIVREGPGYCLKP